MRRSLPSFVRVLRTVALVTCVLVIAACDDDTSEPPSSGIPHHSELAATTPTAGASGVQWSISPIDAVFSQACFCTDYKIDVKALNTNSYNREFRVTWTLHLQLVDRAGAPDPATPRSAAAVDSACNNNGVATTKPLVENISVAAGFSEFSSMTWYHPDPTSKPPGYAAGVFHCDHSKQGPLGHQGSITVTVVHGAQHCTATYWGTKTGTSSGTGQPGAPTCATS